jgi:hypothetical protein
MILNENTRTHEPQAGLNASHPELLPPTTHAPAIRNQLAAACSQPVSRQRLALLILEDSSADAELEVAVLEEAGYTCRCDRVQTRDEFVARLQAGTYDLILADYSLPAFDGLSALKLVQAQGLDVPFILVSGTVGEETAIESLKAGATDYVLKPRLNRLMPVVQRALVERDEHHQRQQAEAALRASEAQLRRLNAELEQRVRERTAQLEASNRELEAFSYSVSHDLRAPLRVIESFGQALAEEYGTALHAQGRHYLERMRAATDRMQQLISDLLQLSRVSRSEMQLTRVDLSQLAHAVAVELLPTQPARPVSFVIADGIVATGDARLLHALLENLLGNAWKFTSKHPTARIEFGQILDFGLAIPDFGKGRTEIRNPKSEIRNRVFFVRDDGAGFDARFAARLFQPFKRLHGTNEFPGLGIGLATVQRIVYRHGGRIWAESTVEGGATFYFTLAPDSIAERGIRSGESEGRSSESAKQDGESERMR